MAFAPVVYSTGAPVLASSGSQRVACPPLAAWLKVYDQLQVFRARGHVVYYQTQGVGVAASGGTHDCGSADDTKYTSDAAIMDAREMGAVQWHRIPGRDGWPSTGADHNHRVLPCGYNSCNQYQIDAYLAGFNGLGANGHAAHDRLPKPSVIRTWQQGIAWAKAEIARLTGTMTTTQEDDPMFIISAPGRGQAVIGSGYYRSLANPEEVAAARAITTSAVEGNDRQFDLWHSIAVSGTGASDLSSIDPATLAAAITALIPKDIAQQVVEAITTMHLAVTAADIEAIAEASATATRAKIIRGA